MPSEALQLLALTLLLAAWLVVHAVTTWQALILRELGGKRWAALLPPVAPFVAWRGGRRIAPVLWGGLLAAYVLLRASTG